MTKKLIVSDLDGTLLRGWFVTPRDRRAVKDFQRTDAFFLATGRDYRSFASFLKWHMLTFDYGILANGALLIDKRQEIICNQTFASHKLLSVFRHEALKEVWPKLIFTFSLGKWVKTYRKFPWEERSRIFNTLPSQLTQASIKVEHPNLVPNVVSYLNDEGLAIETSGPHIDILAVGVSKRQGIEQLIQLAKLADYQLYVIGDSANDLTMFELTENSYGIASGTSEVLKAATHKVSSVAECIAHVRQRDEKMSEADQQS